MIPTNVHAMAVISRDRQESLLREAAMWRLLRAASESWQAADRPIHGSRSAACAWVVIALRRVGFPRPASRAAP